MEWQNELKKLIKNGCSDSDIEDFVYEHPEINERDIWDYVYEYSAPTECKGCKHIQMSGLMPCSKCSRRVKTEDFYEPR